MKQEISVSKNFSRIFPNQLSIGTHSGIFHADDVIAVSLFCINNFESSILVVRSRDTIELSKCDILVDVGGGKYDHHQNGGNGVRNNDVPYASAGLYWLHHGPEIISKLANTINSHLNVAEISSLVDSIDFSLIQEVDKVDNGIIALDHTFDYIETFLPNWQNVFYNDSIYESSFYSVLNISIQILKQFLLSKIAEISCFNYIFNLYKNNTDSKILEIPAQSFPWQEAVTKLNNEFNTKIDFVVFPYPAGGWAAQCVPNNMAEKFTMRVPFPEAWAGQSKDLPQISGISDATFCHNGRFFIRASSHDAILKMCAIALGK